MKGRVVLVGLVLGGIAVSFSVLVAGHEESGNTTKSSGGMLSDILQEYAEEKERVGKLPASVQTLVGIKGVWVVIEDLHEDAKAAGLTTEQLRTDVELKFRLAGITVDTPEKLSITDKLGQFYVNISSVGEAFLSYSVITDLRQAVRLVRNSQEYVADTWSTGTVGYCPARQFAETVRGCVRDDTDRFINDYLAANPKMR